MRILVVHAWLKGNLGDVLQLSVLLSALRELEPAALDLTGYPSPPADATADLTALADRVLPEPFWWFWHYVPSALGQMTIAPRWVAARRTLFDGYDAIVCAPGPYLASYDPRAVPALADIRAAVAARRPIILSGHSIGPLSDTQIADVRQASVCVARESSTFDYLTARGCAAQLAADYAFLYPYEQVWQGDQVQDPPYEVLFLRSDNLAIGELRAENGRVFHGDRVLAGRTGGRLVVATSDSRRDERFVAQVAQRLGATCVVCRSVPDLVTVIGRSSGVVSDRYHPAICAAVLGKPVRVVPNREPHKMRGLTELLAANSVSQLQAMARSGLGAVRAGLTTRH